MSYAPTRSESTPLISSSEFSSREASPTAPRSRSKTRPRRPRRGSGADRTEVVVKDPSAGLDHPLIVHSHLCWNWVWQRPQQFVSRLSRRHEVLFVEMLPPDAALAAPQARVRPAEGYPRITILTLQFPLQRWSDEDYVDQERRRLVQQYLEGAGRGRFANAIQWFYDPMAAPAFLGQLGEALTVYDCMDELSRFQGAPRGIIERERELLKRADVVFAGGWKLFEAKSRHNSNCHFYGCGVDEDHFGKARSAQTTVSVELASLPKPVLGYFGVVDERIDYGLLKRLAESNPGWSVVMVGPVAKVDEALLPRRPNLHWLGQRTYAELPSLCKGFDLCLMPFALNEATEYINPTKALEYMATGRQIISTAVPDVVRNFASVVKVAPDPERFVTLCERVLDEPDVAAIQRGLRMAREQTWDSIVDQLERHVEEALKQNQRNPGWK
jgi:glycosyltransferase involved in cell wall biosynthesis